MNSYILSFGCRILSAPRLGILTSWILELAAGSKTQNCNRSSSDLRDEGSGSRVWGSGLRLKARAWQRIRQRYTTFSRLAAKGNIFLVVEHRSTTPRMGTCKALSFWEPILPNFFLKTLDTYPCSGGSGLWCSGGSVFAGTVFCCLCFWFVLYIFWFSSKETKTERRNERSKG